MILAVDIGNTTIGIGVLAQGEIKASWRIQTNRYRLADEYAAIICELLRIHEIPQSDFEGIIISSVVPSVLRELVSMSERYFHITPIVVSAQEKLGVELRCDYDPP